MKKIISVALFISVLTFGFMHTAEAAVSDWYKGASINPVGPDDFSSASFKQSLQNLKATGATYVALVVPLYQANDTSSEIFNGWDTPSDASLVSAINYAKSIGLQVVLKPHLVSQSNSWRAYINANDRAAWFTSYGNKLNHLGDIGKQTGVQGIVMGTELISMATYTSNGDNTARWNTMISNLRTHFNGYLTYSANWGSGSFAEEAPHIGFWPSLDFIGLSSYYPLAQGQNNPSTDSLIASWDNWNYSKIKPLADQFGKKVFFTEMGYRSVDNAHNDPFDSGRGGGVNLQEQVNDYEALFKYWNNFSYIAGVNIWDWKSNPNAGGSGDTDYTPQNKPALEVMKRWFTSGSAPTPPPVPPQAGAWQATATVSGSSVDIRVTNTGQNSGLIIDTEIYDSNGTKVFQKFVDNQTVSASQPGQYSFTGIPTSSGTYTVKVGVFNNNWSTNYYWGNAVASYTPGGQNPPPVPPPTPPTPQPTSSETNIWWPSNGSSVRGVQPFKAMLTNKNVSDYKMYWQVDGDRLNEMYDSQQDYPHKEVLVDVSGWNWKGAGPYTINFVSKDSSGTIISQKSTVINLTK